MKRLKNPKKFGKLLEQVDTGKRSVDSALCQATEEIKRDERNEELGKIANLHVPDEITLYQGDFAEIPIAKNSIQLILTDLPYGEEYLGEWKILGKIAKEVLVPGGFLIAYCGKLYLQTILNMLSRHLEYYWILSLRARYFLNSPFGLLQAKKNTRGVTIPDLGIRSIKMFKILVPPMEMQKEFSDIVEKVERLKKKQNLSTIETEKLWDSLVSKSFEGDLFADVHPEKQGDKQAFAC